MSLWEWFFQLLYLALAFAITYAFWRLQRRRSASRTAAALFAFMLLYWLVRLHHLSEAKEVVQNFLIYLPVLFVVFFQQQIRRTFRFLGGIKRPPSTGRWLGEGVYDEIVLAATTLASTKTGALIVIERGIPLREMITRGVWIDAELSYDLLVTIFNPATPLHDGAVVISGYRAVAAACFTQITMNPNISRDLGTRHRAAIGITEDTDAVCVVVSEETGLISFTEDGKIVRGLDGTKLRARIHNALYLSDGY